MFDGWNCIVEPSGSLTLLDDRNYVFRTHKMTWLAIQEWAKQSGTSALIGQSLSFQKITFEDCLKSMWPGIKTRPLATALVLEWGSDLAQAAKDQFARNDSSYNPQCLVNFPHTADDTLEFLIELWGLLDPAPGHPFLQLDRYLFRIVVESQYRLSGSGSIKSSNRSSDLANRWRLLDPIVQTVLSESFLSRSDSQSSDDPALIRYARISTASPHPVEMISRALILLRMATAVVTRLLFEAGVTVESDLAFWIGPYGERLGFWGASGPPLAMQDLWEDVSVALDDAVAAQGRRVPFTRSDWASTDANGLPRIFETERAALWGLCP